VSNERAGDREDDRQANDRLLSARMQAAQAGDRDAYQELLTAIQPRVRAIVRSRIREPAAADDVVQNALLSIHRGRASYRAERPFVPWMRAIVRNSITDHFRERKRRGDREASLDVEGWPDEQGATPAEGEALAPELRDALEALPEAQREAVMLIQVEGLSVAEAALRVGVSPGALKVRAHRGYRGLREALEGARIDGAWRSEEPTAGQGGMSGRRAR
jgi:RNA polymerase sigma-70 factor (ECF subfamily)